MTSPKVKLLFHVLNSHQAKLDKMSLDEARRYFEKISKVKYKPRIAQVFDECIGNKNSLKIRVYKKSLRKTPTIVYFHGGGWVVGSIDSHDTVARLLCKVTGFAVISVDYRLAPEFPYPAPIQDGMTVLDWLATNEHGLDAKEVFLAGDSAGGNVALNVALQAACTFKGLLLMYPALDPTLSTDSMKEYAKGYFVTRDNMKQFWEHYAANEAPISLMENLPLSLLPPTLVQTATYDILRDEGKLLVRNIRQAGGSAEYFCYKGTSHGFMQIPSLVSGRNKTLRDIAAFVDKEHKDV